MKVVSIRLLSPPPICCAKWVDSSPFDHQSIWMKDHFIFMGTAKMVWNTDVLLFWITGIFKDFLLWPKQVVISGQLSDGPQVPLVIEWPLEVIQVKGQRNINWCYYDGLLVVMLGEGVGGVGCQHLCTLGICSCQDVDMTLMMMGWYTGYNIYICLAECEHILPASTTWTDRCNLLDTYCHGNSCCQSGG